MICSRLELTGSAVQDDTLGRLETSVSIEPVGATQDGVAFDVVFLDFETARDFFESLRTQNAEFDVQWMRKTHGNPSMDVGNPVCETGSPTQPKSGRRAAMAETTNRSDERLDLSWSETDLLDHPDRRYLCYCLFLYATPMKLLDIATQIGVWERYGRGDHEGRNRHDIYQSLQRKHLPALQEAELVSYNRTEDMTTVGPAADHFERLVERQLPMDVVNLLQAEAETIDSDVSYEGFPNEPVEHSRWNAK